MFIIYSHLHNKLLPLLTHFMIPLFPLMFSIRDILFSPNYAILPIPLPQLRDVRPRLPCSGYIVYHPPITHSSSASFFIRSLSLERSFACSSISSNVRFSSSYLFRHGADLSSANGSKGLGGSAELDDGGGWVGQIEAPKKVDSSPLICENHDCEK